MPLELESPEPDSAEFSYTVHESLELSPINRCLVEIGEPLL